jgi:hypothetical protein
MFLPVVLHKAFAVGAAATPRMPETAAMAVIVRKHSILHFDITKYQIYRNTLEFKRPAIEPPSIPQVRVEKVCVIKG